MTVKIEPMSTALLLLFAAATCWLVKIEKSELEPPTNARRKMWKP